jgi:hypothetical protein
MRKNQDTHVTGTRCCLPDHAAADVAGGGGPQCCPAAPFSRIRPDPDGRVPMVLAGPIGGHGHYCPSGFPGCPPGTVAAAFGHTDIPCAASVGFVVSGPALWTRTGDAVIIAGGVYIIRRERPRGGLESGVSAPPGGTGGNRATAGVDLWQRWKQH